ncbi:hypothetical protein [Burkholderia sp. S-53]|uniref:hypothetical protein n=1 Tax=Burkholderia sp. S-53 TaxID=2906514 RepID=UPI0021D23482|nr:hypothetical protein [Burkholderia sp. S-53]UXU85304.1 hypothetical protein LXM88_02770 [Burkholderia sp. S-53]
MRPITRSTLLAAVGTNGARWVVPTRLALGVLLLFPVDGSIQQRFSFHHGDPSALSFGAVAAGMIPRAIEVLAGVSFVSGFGIRLAGYPMVAIFAVPALANFAKSSAWLRDAEDHVIVPHGDWSCGAMHLAVALLLGDLLAAGSGRWSVDYWLAMKLKAVANPHFRRREDAHLPIATGGGHELRDETPCLRSLPTG